MNCFYILYFHVWSESMEELVLRRKYFRTWKACEAERLKLPEPNEATISQRFFED